MEDQGQKQEIIEGVSPVPARNPKAITYSFPDAIKEVIKGRRITRIEWNTNDDFGILKDGLLQICRNGKFHAWIVSDGDLLANDWVLLPEVN